MATGVIKTDYMTKRSRMKSRFKSENFKARWFVLTPKLLTYYEGTSETGKSKQKGQLILKDVKVVEEVQPEYLHNKPNAFQVVYSELNGDTCTLYIVAVTPEKRDEWIDETRKVANKAGAQFFPRYHSGVYHLRAGKWMCCDKIQRQVDGCEDVTWQEDSASSKHINNNNTHNGDLPVTERKKGRKLDIPLPPPPEDGKTTSKTTGKTSKMVIARYDYQNVEEGDLSLVKGEEYEIIDEEQQHWWKARNKHTKEEGFIPANYVTIKAETDDQLEQYEWFYSNTTRVQTEEILEREHREGCFIVRESTAKGMYTLSLYAKEGSDGITKHYHIRRNPKTNQNYLTERHAFNNIPSLVNYHKHNCAGLITRLRSSPNKEGSDIAPATSGLGHDRYEIDPAELEMHEDLGSGQFGTVKLAIWGKSKKKVAVKMMKEGTMSEDDFIDEAKTMRDLQHKNLVQLYGVCTIRKPIYIVTEYMRHGSLLSYLRRHRNRILQKMQTLLDMSIQVAGGMAYLEEKKFIHRDLAARNCLVGENDVCKVGDFGLARFVLDDEYTSSHGTKFPIRWAPPEVLSFTRFSSKSDVWSFGILMWEIFTGGDMPYGRMRNQELVAKVCSHNLRPDPPPNASDEIYDIMLLCWKDKAEQRPDFSEIKSSLQDIQQATIEYA